MASFSQAKAVGGVGAILVLLSFVPSVGAVLGIVGFIMVLMAVKRISEELGDRRIFNNMMVAVLLSIVGIAVGSLVVVPTILNAFQSGYFNGPDFAPSSSVTIGQWVAFGTAIGLGLLATWVFFLASAFFLRRSYREIGVKLSVSLFGTAGLLYLIGAVTAIVVVGFAIILAAQVLTALAFFSIQEEEGRQQRVPLQTTIARSKGGDK